ncbi:MAG: hypothetical protein OEY91_13145 [Nitrospirota bacterium]|nr:hypothetical protein [Nitrospirota bacterium]
MLNDYFEGHVGPQERCISEASWRFKKGSSSPVLSFAEGKAAVLLAASLKGRPLFALRAYFLYVSTKNWRPACAKPLRRRQGTPLAAFFNSLHIADGDTITVLNDSNEQIKIRLNGIDCPEKTQAYGKKFQQFAKDLVHGKCGLVEG